MVTQPAPAPSGPAAPGPPPRPPSRLARALWAAIFVGGCALAVWQGYLFYRGRAAPTEALPAEAGETTPTAPWAASSSRPAADDPLGASGLWVARGDPGDIPPPPGASRVLRREYRLGEQVWREAAYDFRGSPESAEEHYRKALIQAGFRIVRVWGTPSTRRTIGFAQGSRAGTVSLRNASPEATMTRIVVRIPRPAD